MVYRYSSLQNRLHQKNSVVNLLHKSSMSTKGLNKLWNQLPIKVAKWYMISLKGLNCKWFLILVLSWMLWYKDRSGWCKRFRNILCWVDVSQNVTQMKIINQMIIKKKKNFTQIFKDFNKLLLNCWQNKINTVKYMTISLRKNNLLSKKKIISKCKSQMGLWKRISSQFMKLNINKHIVDQINLHSQIKDHFLTLCQDSLKIDQEKDKGQLLMSIRKSCH